jgi:DNA (cytosine-5)-methyltransferase 1
MRYLSVCSGIEAASVAWGPLGWRAAAFSEIEPFPCAVLAHHYPDVPNLGDMTTIAQRVLNGEVEAPDVLAGGTPCQSFSIAGLRKSLADERGNLTLKFVEIADAIDSVRVRDGHPPAIVVWENVHGVLSTKDNAFGCFLAGLAGEDEPLQPPGGKWANAGAVYGPARAIAWRVLDAQYFGLAQQRRRVFVVASAREGFDPAKVLFEFDGVRRDTAPCREERQTAPTIPARSTGGGGLGTDFDYDGGLIHVDPIARCVTAGEAKRQDGETCNFIAFHPTQNPISRSDGSTHALSCGSTGGQASVAVALRGREGGATQVRRLTPRECERLMGSPDDYTLVPLPLKGRQTRVRWASDSARYKALGNSWAVPVVRWIGERINAAVEHIKHERKAQ